MELPYCSGGDMRIFFQWKNIYIIALFFLLILFFSSINSSVHASFPAYENTLNPEDEVFDDLFLQGIEVNIAGKVHGMLFVLGEKVVIQSTAQIENDIFILGRNVQVEDGAKLAGNLMILGQNVILNAPVARNLFVSSATLDISSTSTVQRNLFFGGFHFSQAADSAINGNLYAACYQVALKGKVAENFKVSAVAVDLIGEIDGNAEITIDASGDDEGMRIWLPYMQQLNIPELLPAGLTVGEQAAINGKLIYTSAKNLEENLKNLALGGVVVNQPKDKEKSADNEKIIHKNPFVTRLVRALRQLIGFSLFTLLGWKLIRRYLPETAQYAVTKPINAMGVGFISTLVVYLGSLIFIILVILIAILLGIFTLNQLNRMLLLSGIAFLILTLVAFSILFLYGSKLVLAYWAGNLILKLVKTSISNKLGWSLVIGLICYLLINAIPIFGWLTGVLVSLIGLGAIWYTVKNHDQAGVIPDFD
jgi:hypothetical protein